MSVMSREPPEPSALHTPSSTAYPDTPVSLGRDYRPGKKTSHGGGVDVGLRSWQLPNPTGSCCPVILFLPSSSGHGNNGKLKAIGHNLEPGLLTPALVSTGLKAFRQQLRKNARTKGFLGLNKIKGLARQVCQSSIRAPRGGMSTFHTPAPSSGLQGCTASSREGRNLLEEVLHQQR